MIVSIVSSLSVGSVFSASVPLLNKQNEIMHLYEPRSLIMLNNAAQLGKKDVWRRIFKINSLKTDTISFTFLGFYFYSSLFFLSHESISTLIESK